MQLFPTLMLAFALAANTLPAIAEMLTIPKLIEGINSFHPPDWSQYAQNPSERAKVRASIIDFYSRKSTVGTNISPEVMENTKLRSIPLLGHFAVEGNQVEEQVQNFYDGLIEQANYRRDVTELYSALISSLTNTGSAYAGEKMIGMLTKEFNERDEFILKKLEFLFETKETESTAAGLSNAKTKYFRPYLFRPFSQRGGDKKWKEIVDSLIPLTNAYLKIEKLSLQKKKLVSRIQRNMLISLTGAPLPTPIPATPYIPKPKKIITKLDITRKKIAEAQKTSVIKADELDTIQGIIFKNPVLAAGLVTALFLLLFLILRRR